MAVRLTAGLILLLVAPHLSAREQTAPGSPSEKFGERVRPLLTQYCYSCHSGAEPKAGFAVDVLAEKIDLEKDRDSWELIADYVREKQMPPPKKPQPTPDQAEQLTVGLEKELARLDSLKKPDPGRVTLRRLNRAEYNNTIRDLFGVDLKPAADFPADDLGYGFDNIGDVLSMPPLLMERYLATAQKVVEAAIIDPKNFRPDVKTFQDRQLKDRGTLGTTGEIGIDFYFRRDGEYVLRAIAFADQAGDEPAKMAFRLDKATIQTVEVTAERDGEPQTFQIRLPVKKGNHRYAVAFLNDFYDPKHPDQRRRDRNLFVVQMAIEGPVDYRADDLPASHKKVMICQPSPTMTASQCARTILSTFARRAYRRPVDKAELDRLVGYVELVQQEGGSFEQGIQLALQAVLVSPNFLFRIELDPEPGNSNAIHSISDHELASRLSYFLWSSMPDDELLDLADKQSLRQSGVLEAQVRRMLRDPKGHALVDNFAGQWLETRKVATVIPDRKLYPGFDRELREGMRQETELFFAEIMTQDRSVLEFLDADYTFLNERLAKHYGIDGVKGKDFRRVALKGDQRGGVLSQASFLTITSNPTRTSPVKRGKWVLEQLLGAPPPPPPPNVPELKEDKKVVATGSLRQRFEAHRSKTECAACHQRMDPIGFGLENYNAIGAWRVRDGNFDVDSSGTLPSGESFKGPDELKRILLESKKEAFVRCLAEKMLTYAMGRGTERFDKPAIDLITKTVIENDYRFSALVLAIVRSDPFQMRRGEGQTP